MYDRSCALYLPLHAQSDQENVFGCIPRTVKEIVNCSNKKSDNKFRL